MASTVTLELSATDDVSGVGKMVISNQPDFAGAPWEALRNQSGLDAWKQHGRLRPVPR